MELTKKPPSEMPSANGCGGTRQGFPEANEMSFWGSLRGVTEGARATLTLYKLYGNAFSLSRPRQAAGASSLPEGAFLCLVNFPDKSESQFTLFNDSDSTSSRYRCSRFHLKHHIAHTNPEKIF